MSCPRRVVALSRFCFPWFAVLLFVGSHWPRLSLVETDVEVWLSLDKFAHVVGYAGLAGLAWGSGFGGWLSGRLAAKAGVGVRWPAWLMVVLFCGVYALVDEGTQPWVGRTMAWPDLLADAVGVGLGLGLVWWVRRWWRVEFGGLAAEPSEATDGFGEEGAVDGGVGFVGSAALVSGLTLVSRVLGLVRDAVLFAMLGVGQTSSAFFFGFMVPNLFRRLFGEGALTAAFLPRYRRLLDEDPGLAGRYARVCGWSAVGVVSGLVVGGELVLLGLWWWVGGDGGKADLALGLTALMLPYAPLICGVAFWSAVLQARGRFGPGAIAPVVLNVGMIVASGLAAWWSSDEVTRVLWVSAGVLVCGLMQVAMIGWAVRGVEGVEGGDGRSLDKVRGLGQDDGPSLAGVMRATLWAMGPMVVGLGVFQINTLLDGLIAYGLSAPEGVLAGESLGGFPDEGPLFGMGVPYPMEAGAVAKLSAAQRLYQFPLGVFGIAIATAIFPALSAAGRSEAREAFSGIVRRGIRLTWFVGLPAAVGLVLVREPLVRVVFERGAFETEDAEAVAWVLLGYGSAVWAYSLTHVLTRAFYARDDAWTPLAVALGMVGLNVGLNLTLIWPLGAAGLAWSTAISATAQCLVLVTLLSKHADEPLGRGVSGGMARGAGCVLAMALALWGVGAAVPEESLNWAGALALLLVMVPTGAVVYVAAAMGLRCAELRWLLGAK